METLEECISKRLGFSPAKKTVHIEAKCDKLKANGSCPERKCQESPGKR